MSTLSRLIVGVVLGCALGLVGACAGDRHMGPRSTEAFDRIFALQTSLRPEASPTEMTGDEAEQAVANGKQMSIRPENKTGGGSTLLQLQR